MIVNYLFLLLIFIPKISFADDVSCITKNGMISRSLSLDINGDGVDDNLKLIKNIEKCVIKKAFSPWTDKEERHDITIEGSAILMSIKNHNHIIYDDEVPSILSISAISNISTIIASNIPEVLRNDLKNAKGDILIIPTESGIDSYLFWNGKQYQTLFPNEEPW